MTATMQNLKSFFNNTLSFDYLCLMLLFNVRNTIFFTLRGQFWKGIHTFNNLYLKDTLLLVFLDKVHLDKVGHPYPPLITTRQESFFQGFFLCCSFLKGLGYAVKLKKKLWL